MQNIKDQAKETEERKKKAEYDKQEAVRQRCGPAPPWLTD